MRPSLALGPAPMPQQPGREPFRRQPFPFCILQEPCLEGLKSSLHRPQRFIFP